MVVEKKDSSKGRVIFSLAELPPKVVYLTPLGNSIERVSDTEALYKGTTKILFSARADLLGNAKPKTDVQKGTGSSTASSDHPEDSEETKQTIREAEQISAQSHAAMKRILQKAEATKQVAANTMTRLDEQGEQIKRIQGNLDTMEGHFDVAEHELKSISSVWGQFGNAIVGPPKKTYDTNAKVEKDETKQRDKFSKEMEKEQKKKEKADRKMQKEMAKRGIGASNDALPEELGVLSQKTQTEVRETDQMLDQLGGNLDELKRMALQMGSEIQIQNSRLDTLQASTERSDSRLKAANYKVKKAM